MIVRLILGILILVGILILQLVLMGIARFFERTSKERTWYQVYILPICLFTFSILRYLFQIPQVENTWPDFIGDPIANILLSIGSLILYSLGNLLYGKMMEGKY